MVPWLLTMTRDPGKIWGLRLSARKGLLECFGIRGGSDGCSKRVFFALCYGIAAHSFPEHALHPACVFFEK